MMSIWVAIGLMALLFALFGILRPRHCDGECRGCGAACTRYTGEEDNVTR
jgi:hypothetical protein